jgi:HSF-type DNA-binding
MYIIAGCVGTYADVVSSDLPAVKRLLMPAAAASSKRKGPRGGVSEPFPLKLYEMLAGLESEDRLSIAAWREHGRCFAIIDHQSFAQTVVQR